MGTQRQIQFVHLQVTWMLGAILLLALLDTASLEVFVFLSMIGLLVVFEYTAPVNVVPSWRRRVRWLILLVASVFAYFVLRIVFEVDGVLPVGVST
ncbi:hypothetical protein D8Y22_12445 [Salinadaptatus halalkaliphilus]|uniref:Uncharacterized protein n=1 Tax=Salinadaptatus halalkaliphilus TaxID=2419781 RepID=A0A4S3TPC4_9EURY|nr:hypothetical protein [Salinadaptatus halalkaliphilus]THE64448.1 hypothetical protein D8Y22_12445 [Salinadaptatus halalkaliphilus]